MVNLVKKTNTKLIKKILDWKNTLYKQKNIYKTKYYIIKRADFEIKKIFIWSNFIKRP